MAAEAAPHPPVAPEATAVIAEDEQALREELQAHLGALWPRLKILASAANGVDALSLFEKLRPDVMFLDIQMPGLTGLEVAQHIDEQCHLVFITAYDAHAVAAFEAGAIDYVLKPYEPDRLAQAIRRVQARLTLSPPSVIEQLRAIAEAVRPKQHLTWIKASAGPDVKLILVSEICYFRADEKYTTVATAEHEFIIRRAIKDLIAELDPSHFWQIHRSTIVNVGMIHSVRRNLAGGTVLTLKGRPERLAVSEAHRHLFKHM